MVGRVVLEVKVVVTVVLTVVVVDVVEVVRSCWNRFSNSNYTDSRYSVSTCNSTFCCSTPYLFLQVFSKLGHEEMVVCIRSRTEPYPTVLLLTLFGGASNSLQLYFVMHIFFPLHCNPERSPLL